MQFFTRLINDDYVAATESGTWWVFVLRYDCQQEVGERYWEIVEEGWFSD